MCDKYRPIFPGCTQKMSQSESEPEVMDDEEIELGSQDTDEEDDEEYMDIAAVLGGLLASEDDNVCTAMIKVAKQLETQNKILVKILSQISNSKKDS